MTTHNNGFGAVVTLEETLPETMVISWDPDRLLRVVGLEHVLTLHLQGDDQVRGWIRIRLTGFSKLDVARHVGEGWFAVLQISGLEANHKETSVLLLTGQEKIQKIFYVQSSSKL